MRDWGRWIFVVAACLFAATSITADETVTGKLIYEGGSVRDIAGNATGGSVYLSSYASDEVVEIDPADGSVRRRAKVPKGPAAIITGSASVAVLSRAASSVSILNPADLSVRASVPVTPGTRFLFAAGNDRVGALNPFSGEVCLIDLQVGGVTKKVALEGGVPVGAAFDGERIVVVGRTSSVVWSLNAESLEVTAVKQLSVAPRAIVAISPRSFAVETDTGLMLLDGATLEARSTMALQGKSLDIRSGGMLVVADGAAQLLGVDLQTVGTVPLADGVDSARSIGTAIFGWSATLGRIWRMDGAATATTVAATTPPVTPIEPAAEQIAAATVSAEVEPLPAAVTTTAETPAAEAPQASASSLQLAAAPESANAPEPTTAPPPEPAPVPAAAEPESVPQMEPEYRFTLQPSRLGLGGFKPYAPHFGDPTGRTFRESLARALNVGNDKNSLLSADFPERLDNLRFGHELRSIKSGDRPGAEADGGVEFDLGDVHVKTDSISLHANPRELLAEGSPVLTRGDSILTASRIYAFDTKLSEIPGFRPIVPSAQEKAAPHPLIPRGYKDPIPRARPPLGTIELDDVTLNETGRRIMADSLEVNTVARSGNLINPEGQLGPLYFAADSLRVRGPGSVTAEDLWLTTCDFPEPHYRFRFSNVESERGEEVTLKNARLQLGRVSTPLYIPRYKTEIGPGAKGFGTEIEIGGSSELGSAMNVAQWFVVSDSVNLAPRVYATSRQGIGVGFDTQYNFMNEPASAFFRSQGQLRTLYTTEQNGYTEWYHRQELTPDVVVIGQWEQWYERDVVKEFYRGEYENRTGPRTFVSLAYTQPEYLVTGTVAPSTHGFTRETEKLPELTFSLFERQLAGGFYGTFDAIGGYYATEPETIEAGRATTLARLSYDWNVARGFNVLPFVELDGTYYTQTLDESGDSFRGTALMGVTVQARVQRSYPGIGNFTGFKHIIIPSATLSYRPDATLDAAENPQFDSFDNRPGRLRVESTLDNILLGRNLVNNKVWPVARLTFYQGSDLENEAIKANDYEIDLEVRPRPAWGVRTVAEIHNVSDSSELPGDDFNRVISYAFYDNLLHKNTLNGRVGFAFTEAGEGVVNEEVLYGVGYKIAKKWSVAFEHRYDFERNKFTRQTYSLRRKLHDWEVGFMVRDRDESIDVGIQINLVNFPEIGTGF